MEHLTFEFKSLGELEETKNEHGQDVATMWGLASTYDVDRGNDKVMPGAFASATARGTSFLFGHDQKQPIGRVLELKETGRGLEFKAELILEVQRAREVAALVKAGALHSTSIGYRTKKADFVKELDPSTNKHRRVRRLQDIQLAEISVVPVPMNTGAVIHGIKSWDDGMLPDLPIFEEWLREAAGFSRSQAKCVIAKGYRHVWNEHKGHIDEESEREAGSEIDEHVESDVTEPENTEAETAQKASEDHAPEHSSEEIAKKAVDALFERALGDISNLIGDLR